MKNVSIKILTRPTYVEINTTYLHHNFNEIKKQIIGKKLMCVVKGNAYGHGLVQIAQEFQKIGADYLAVAIPEEGIELREHGITIPILVLSAIADSQIEMCITHNLSITAPSDQKLIAINIMAEKLQKRAIVHIKIDTGMGRIGVHYSRIQKFFSIMSNCIWCNFEGLYSHLAFSDQENIQNTIQIKRFTDVVSQFNFAGFSFPLVHLANSGGIFFYPDSHFNMVRSGIALYGLLEGRELPTGIYLKPVLSWKTEVVYFKYIEKNTGIGYGHDFISKNETRIVTLPIGYADGYQRAMGKNGRVIINNTLYPITGRICMDQMMVDIGQYGEAFPGDEVMLIGSSKNKSISFYDIAKNSDTSIYELLSQISARVPRIYI